MKPMFKHTAARVCRKIGLSIVIILTVAIFSTVTAFAGGQWYESGGPIRQRYDHGNGYYRNEWAWIDFNGDGIAERYCFDIDGDFYRDETTPDGCQVNKAGEWTVGGEIQHTYVYSGSWKQDEEGWRYDHDGGIYACNEWVWVDRDGDYLAERYCFDKNGYMYCSTKTPDGCQVSESGAWVIDGTVQTVKIMCPSALPDKPENNLIYAYLACFIVLLLPIFFILITFSLWFI